MTSTNDVDAQLAAAADARNRNADAVALLALKSVALSLRGRTSARYLEVTEGDQGAFDVSFQDLLDAEGNDIEDADLNDDEQYDVMQLEDWRLNELVGPEEAPTFITVWFNGRTPVWRIDLAAASELEAPAETAVTNPMEFVARVFGNQEVAYELGKHMTCPEADTLAVGIALGDQREAAITFLIAHAHGDDDPDDKHVALIDPAAEQCGMDFKQPALRDKAAVYLDLAIQRLTS